MPSGRGSSSGSSVLTEVLRAGIGKQNMPGVARFAERQKRLVEDIAEYAVKQEAEAEAEAGAGR